MAALKSRMNAEPSTSQLPERIADCVQDVLGARPISTRRVSHQGCTPTERFVVALPDGATAFIKAAVSERTAGDLRREHFIYTQVRGPFMPQFLGWRDDGALPILLIENLEDAFWPPPWTRGHIETVQRTLSQVAATPAPPGLDSLETVRDELSGWRRVADDPRPFLSLQLCSARWLEAALPALLAASDAAVLEGDALLHIDVRSDNLCLRNEQAALIDWNHAARGNALVDVVGWLPSLHDEGGPAPDEIVGDEGADITALLTGYFASRAGLPPVSDAPRVRPLQLRQLAVALPWAARVLSLPPPDVGT